MKPYENLSLESMPGEVWKDIPGWEGFYQASNIGRVKSIAHTNFQGKTFKDKILRQHIRTKGYLGARLYKEGKQISYHVARLVAICFINNPDNKPTIDHINTDKKDNRVENLRWATHHENMMNPISLEQRRLAASIKYPPKAKSPDKRFRPIIAFNPQTKEVKEYRYINECIADGFDRRLVGRVCRKQRKTTCGWAFFYKDDPDLKSYLPR